MLLFLPERSHTRPPLPSLCLLTILIHFLSSLGRDISILAAGVSCDFFGRENYPLDPSRHHMPKNQMPFSSQPQIKFKVCANVCAITLRIKVSKFDPSYSRTPQPPPPPPAKARAINSTMRNAPEKTVILLGSSPKQKTKARPTTLRVLDFYQPQRHDGSNINLNLALNIRYTNFLENIAEWRTYVLLKLSVPHKMGRDPQNKNKTSDP